MLWPLDPHTRGKHKVLREYLNAWLPILGMNRNAQRILFIDGFAGPGEYQDGEEGSPLIALRALKEHIAKDRFHAEVVYLFIEKEHDRAVHLQSLVDTWRKDLPSRCRILVIEGAFDATMSDALDYIENQAQNLAPSFVMIDPFGVQETPMSVIKRILQNPRSEVYISFMYESINRFKVTPEFAPHLDDLFGCQDWRTGIDISDRVERKDFFYGLYENQLRNAGAQYVVHFDLYRGNRLIYAVFFGTGNALGCDKMKQAVWKIAPFGDYSFHGTKSDQLTLDIENPNFEPLKSALQNEFCNRTWVTVEEITTFVASDQTDYHSGQLKRYALRPLEKENRILVDETSRKRKGTYPDGTRIRFV